MDPLLSPHGLWSSSAPLCSGSVVWFRVDWFVCLCSTEVIEEKTSGRRRSTSRKKSNTIPVPDPDPEPTAESPADPEPSHDTFSPQHEPDPDPPPQDHTAAPRAEEEDGSCPSGPLLASSPGEESRVSPLPASPSPSHSPRPAPDPEEEDQPSLSRSPTPMEVDHNPSPVAMETQECTESPAASCPMHQSPAPSPCSSPPVSPCLRLEEEDSLSPLFQRCLSEDSGGSPTPSLGDTKKR